MSKEEDIRSRLQGAALELFRTRGYDRTTAAGIAAQAGVTERTFFRYFPDKREVLFYGETAVRDALTTAIVDAPADLGPLDTLFHAFRSFRPMLEAKWAYAKPRHDIISTTPALHERELAKIDALADALADAVTARGVPALRAALAALAAMAAFVHPASAWLDDPGVALGTRLDAAFEELRALLGDGGAPR